MPTGSGQGAVEIQVKEGGEVSGRFRSDLNGSVYPVSGKVAADKPQRIGFIIQFPRAEQEYTGVMWTEGKNVIAGTFTMLERPFSFVAVRDGASLAVPEVEFESARPLHLSRQRRIRVVVLESDSDRLVVDGISRSAAQLKEVLAPAIKLDPATEVLLRVPATVPFDLVSRAPRRSARPA